MDFILYLPDDILYKIILEAKGARKLTKLNKKFQQVISPFIDHFIDIYYELVPNWKKNIKKLVDELMKRKKLDSIKFLINNYIVNKFSLLASAAKYGNLTMFEYSQNLLESGTPLNKITSWAILGNNKDIILYCIERGATNYNEIAAWAVSQNLMEIINMIPVEKMDQTVYRSMLYSAIKSKNINMYNFALKHIKNINRNKISLTAAKYGNLEVFNHKGIDREKAMLLALKNSQMNIVRFLLDKGGINLYSVILRGSVQSNNIDIIKYFISNNYINVFNVLLYTVEIGKLELFKQLTAVYKDFDKEALLSRASFINQLNFIKYLAKNQEDFKIVAERTRTIDVARYVLSKYPIFVNIISMNTAKYREYSVLRYTLKRGSTNINKIALYAVKRNNDELIEIALDNGANNLKSLYKLCIKFRHPRIALHLIKKYGASISILNKLAVIAVKTDNLFVLIKLFEYGINNAKRLALIAARRNYITILFYLLNHNQGIINEVIDTAMNYGNKNLVEIIKKYLITRRL